MLIDSFFKIKQIENNGNIFRFVVSIQSEHEVFEGHFPHLPVVPGVFVLQMIKECFEQVQNKKYRYLELKNCKFSRPIFPDSKKDFRIECEYTGVDSLLLKAVVQSEDTVYITLKAELEEI